ncbi:S66 peptidase family protein [Pedobacter caeni]|uniref:Muramoyltetrapeptide carboxypeptidase n=1 Tax=Pedobacter caeni TaxID=288992 RepID=A0A1M5MQB2_9SPHI|nr:LD-carboxypeptidase [Pedobacter caeni]SHG79574.1 muramoyltetrapeptide carboxypeptidase [Pedobacter caeni]
MIKQPAHLKKGDKIAIVSPAKKLPGDINSAISILEQWGLEVIRGENLYAEHHQFAGTDAERTKDLQTFLDDPDIRAIFASRGGYGTIRIIDELDFTRFKEDPKWVIGFSDITILLSHLFAVLDTQSIHGQMPKTFDDATPESLESLRKALFGESLSYEYKSEFKNRTGDAEGILIGGNLTLMVMTEGSESAVDYTDKILFLEDVGEHEYAIDRLMRMLKRSGKLSRLKGLIIGTFNGITPEDTPFGWSPEEIIMEIVKEYNYPVCFNFPVGHIDDNRSLIVGKAAKLSVDQKKVSLKFL